jgi:hypothetical protein
MTFPQRRAIAACAPSKEPRAASIAASFARVWEWSLQASRIHCIMLLIAA